MEFEEVCLETVILSSSNLFQGFKFIPGCFIRMVWIEHVGKCVFYMVKVLICRFDSGIGENVQPGICKVASLSFAHSIEQGY